MAISEQLILLIPLVCCLSSTERKTSTCLSEGSQTTSSHCGMHVHSRGRQRTCLFWIAPLHWHKTHAVHNIHPFLLTMIGPHFSYSLGQNPTSWTIFKVFSWVEHLPKRRRSLLSNSLKQNWPFSVKGEKPRSKFMLDHQIGSHVKAW